MSEDFPNYEVDVLDVVQVEDVENVKDVVVEIKLFDVIAILPPADKLALLRLLARETAKANGVIINLDVIHGEEDDEIEFFTYNGGRIDA